jgi:hypothetical protein
MLFLPVGHVTEHSLKRSNYSTKKLEILEDNLDELSDAFGTLSQSWLFLLS